MDFINVKPKALPKIDDQARGIGYKGGSRGGRRDFAPDTSRNPGLPTAVGTGIRTTCGNPINPVKYPTTLISRQLSRHGLSLLSLRSFHGETNNKLGYVGMCREKCRSRLSPIGPDQLSGN